MTTETDNKDDCNAINTMSPKRKPQAGEKVKGVEDNDLESIPSLTVLRAELTAVHAQSFKTGKDEYGHDNNNNNNEWWDPRKSKLERLKKFADERSQMLPSHLTPESHTRGELEGTPSITTLRAELSGVHPQSFKPGKGNVLLDVSESKLDRLRTNEDNRSKELPSRERGTTTPPRRYRRNDLIDDDDDDDDSEQFVRDPKNLDRDPSLTTLRAELSEVHAKSFRTGRNEEPEWNPRQSKLDKLKANTDHRSHHIPALEKKHPNSP